jgi:putative tryptophan/tyrosine transport system substrate-binding protein
VRRREVIACLGCAGMWPFAAHAQQPSRMKHLAIVEPEAKPADVSIEGNVLYSPFFRQMKSLGYVEGGNLIVQRYCLEGRYDRSTEVARDVVASRPDVIFTSTNYVTLALKSETRTIPIVAFVGDPVATGIVSSLARPGGNITGVSVDAGAEIAGKRLELLAEAVGKLSNVRLLQTPEATGDSPFVKMTREAAEKMNISFRLEPLQSPVDEAAFTRAFDAMQRDHVDGVVIFPDGVTYKYRVLLGRLALQYHLPAICWFSETVEAGALMSYAALNFDEEARRLATQVVEILNGGDPAEMPFFLENHFVLVINLKAAKELGLELPVGLVASANKLIE